MIKLENICIAFWKNYLKFHIKQHFKKFKLLDFIRYLVEFDKKKGYEKITSTDMESDCSVIKIFILFFLSIKITCHVLGGSQSEKVL